MESSQTDYKVPGSQDELKFYLRKLLKGSVLASVQQPVQILQMLLPTTQEREKDELPVITPFCNAKIQEQTIFRALIIVHSSEMA